VFVFVEIGVTVLAGASVGNAAAVIVGSGAAGAVCPHAERRSKDNAQTAVCNFTILAVFISSSFLA